MQLRSILVTLALLLLAAQFTAATAQEDSPPPEINLAFAALEVRTGEPINFQTIAGFEWEAQSFNDASLGCPSPDQAYAQVITPGYQFFLTYAGVTYDYRVPENANSADQVVLCDIFPAQPTEPTDTAPTPPPSDGDTECGAFYEVVEGDTLSEIAVECGTTLEALLAVNPDIVEPSLIYAGQRLAIPSSTSPYNASIAPDTGPPGTTATLTGTGFPPGARVQYGLGRFQSEYDVVGTREIGADGTLQVPVTIPAAADIGEEWVGVIVLNNQESVSEVFEVTETGLFNQTQMFLVALGDAGRSGTTIGCNDSLIPVTIDINPTIAPLTAALEELLAVDERIYGQSGLYNALYRSELTLESVAIEDSEATIELSGNLAVGGVCDVPRITQQLRQTALQYSTVDTVSIFINGEPLQSALS